MNADGSNLSRVTEDGAPKGEPVWDPDGRALIYSERRGSVSRLLRVSASGGEPVAVPGGADFRALRPGPDGALYGLKVNDRRLWRLPRTGGVAALVSPTFQVEDGWAIGPLGVHQVRSGFTRTPSLWFRSWSGEDRKLADLPTVAPNPTVAVDPRTGALVFPRMLRDESDIALLDLRSRT
jgi:hypothetical protein